MTEGVAGRLGRLPLGRVRLVPAHVAVMLGLSTAAYSVSLAAVAADQSQTDAATQAARAPALDAVSSITRANDILDATVGRADSELNAVTSDYGAAGNRLAELEATLAGFAGTVAGIDGVSRALPATVPLPALSRTSRTSIPMTHATTGASGVP
jgi:hypothetical protein